MRVIIIGKGTGWHKAPYVVEGKINGYYGQVWGVNNVCLRRDVDLAFNMHDLDKHRNHPLFKKTIEHVNKNKISIVTQKMYEHIPTSIEFPLEKMPRKYFTNSIDYMVAYAWETLVTTIEMYGVVMAVGTEYAVQRASLEYWIGMFEGDGGEVIVHEPTFVCVSSKGLYGYDWDEEAEPHVLAREENK